MVSIDELMNRFTKNQDEKFTIKIGSDEYACRKLPFKQILEIDDQYDVETQSGAYDRNLEVIYLSCDLFRKLLDRVEVEGEPHNIISKVLSPVEILEFYTLILNQYVGQLNKDVETVKK